MGSAVVPILQVVCLVFVVIAIVNVLRTQRNLNEITKKMETGLWKFVEMVRMEMEARLKKVEDAIASLQRQVDGMDRKKMHQKHGEEG